MRLLCCCCCVLKEASTDVFARFQNLLRRLSSELHPSRSLLEFARLRRAATSRHQDSGGASRTTTVLWFEKK